MEQANGMSQGQDNISSPGLTPQAPAQSTPVQTPDERIFRQSEVNDIVKRAKLSAVDDFKRLQSEQPSYFQQKYGNEERTSVPQQQSNNTFSEDNIRKIVSEENKRDREQWMQESRNQYEIAEAKKTVEQFWNKVNPAREKYQDFDKVLGTVDLSRYPDVVGIIARDVENGDDVLYHLLTNEAKMADLQKYAEDKRYSHIAVSKAKQLAQSLKDNATASKVRIPNEPLSQMRPSNAGTDNGAMTVKDYRSKYRV